MGKGKGLSPGPFNTEGYNHYNIIAETLNEGSLIGSQATRPAGVLEVQVTGSFTITAGSPQVTLILEGSMDGTDWFNLGQTVAGAFDVTGETLNVGLLSVGRFRYLRVRAVQVVAGTWTLAVDVSGVAHQGAYFYDSETITRTGATENGTAVSRRVGVRYITAVYDVTAIVNGGQTATVALQGSPDGGTSWVTLGSVSGVNATGSGVIEVDGSSLVDLGGFNQYRIQITDTGVTSYTIVTYLASDDSDWIYSTGPGNEAGGSSGEALTEMLLKASVSSVNVDADNYDVIVQLLKGDNTPLLESIPVQVALYDSTLGGLVDLAANATISAVSIGTARAGVATNRAIISTDATGAMVFRVNNAVDPETVFCAAIPGGVPVTTDPRILTQSDEVSLAFV